MIDPMEAREMGHGDHGPANYDDMPSEEGQ